MKTTLTIAALVLSASALAQVPSNSTAPSGGTTQATPTFESLDTNADGRISASEAQASPSLASKFTMLDKQNKGYITKEEFQTYMKSSGSTGGSSKD